MENKQKRPRGRPTVPLILDQDERDELERWARRRKTAQGLAMRARIVLLCSEGLNNKEVASQLRTTAQTVGLWRRRFLERRADGLLDEPRPGAPRRIGDDEVERVVRLTLETKPKKATHWSTRDMAEACGMSQSMVSRIWRAFGLQPHRSDGERYRLMGRPGAGRVRCNGRDRIRHRRRRRLA